MKLTANHLRQISRASSANANMKSIVVALEQYGPRFGLNRAYRLAHFIAQLSHESAYFIYDKEVWGPTAAQKRYDGRADLGNTPEIDGDGKKYSGHGPIQVTGKANHREFRDWCRERGMNPPDFVKNPELINTDPWEGLSAIWYWDTRHLNKYADRNDPEMITRRINGGLNGFADRLDGYVLTALVFLGFNVTRKKIKASVEEFQILAKSKGHYSGKIDSDPGPGTRAAMHLMLVAMDSVGADEEITASPVIAILETKVAVAPAAAEKSGKGVIGLLATAAVSSGSVLANLSGTAQIIAIVAIVGLVGLMITGHLKLGKTIRDVRKAIEG